MALHDYTPQQAFEELMRQLQARNADLADHIRSVVNAGKDIEEEDFRKSKGRRKKRSYRRTVAYSYEEALKVALHALRSYFVEQPLFINSVNENLAAATVELPAGRPRFVHGSSSADVPFDADSRGKDKVIEVELQTETQISRVDVDRFPMKRIGLEDIESQKQNIAKLESFFEFRE